MKTVEDFYNKVASDIHMKYFPEVKYHRDDETCQKSTYAIELFNNGCITYSELISKLSKSCNDTKKNIHDIVGKYIHWSDYRYVPRN